MYTSYGIISGIPGVMVDSYSGNLELLGEEASLNTEAQ